MKGLYAMRAYVVEAIDEVCSRSDPPRWRDQERRKYRIAFASSLSAVYEVAYQKPATVNSWADDEGRAKLGSWPDFFARIGKVAFKLDRVPDVEGTFFFKSILATRRAKSTGI